MPHFAKLGPGYDRDRHEDRDAPRDRAPVPGRMTYSQWLPPAEHVVQRKAEGERTRDPAQTHAHAAAGVRDASGKLPFVIDIQRAFGRHDVSRITAQIGGAAREAARAIGAAAYAYGERVAFAGEPDLHTAAHEAAHVVQQRAGVALANGVGATGDRYEQHANAVADLVVAGQSAEPLLDALVGGAPAATAAPAVVQREDADHDGIDDALVECALPAEPLAELLAVVRRTPTTALAATTAALTPAARRRTRADAVYQFPIAHRAHAARGSDLAALADAVRSTTHLALETVEARQDWTPYDRAVAAPLVEVERPAIEAVRENAALGFHASLIQALWHLVVPEEHHARVFFTRTFTEALERRGLPRVLTAATLRTLDIASELEVAAVDDHYNAAPWTTMPEEEFTRLAARLAARVGVAAPALTRTAAPPPRRGRRARPPRIEVSDELVHAVVLWQAWQHRRAPPTHWGRLTTADLVALGVAPAASGEAIASESASPESTSPESTSSSAPSEAAAPESPASPSAPASLAHDYNARIGELLAEMAREARAARHPRRPTRDAAPTPVAPPPPAARDRLASYLDTVVLPGMAAADAAHFSLAQMVRRGDTETITAWANRVRAALAERAGEAGAHTADAAATDALARRGLLVGLDDLHVAGWDERLYDHETDEDGHRHRTATPAERAARIIPRLETYRGLLQRLLAQLTAGLTEGGAALSAALAAIVDADLTPPELLRHHWHVTWPRAPDPHADAAHQRGEAQRWRTLLGGVLRNTLSEIRTTPAYLHPIVNDNPDAVAVDLNRTGVEITSNFGNVLPASEMRLDPVFAAHMADFLDWLAGLGVTRMWTAGFLRSAMSPQDTHPMGMACDITGFTFAAPRSTDSSEPETQLLLRNGQPGRDGALGSAWFDHHSHLGAHSYAEIMTGIAAQMTHHFDRIIGPGHNPEHMNHFHVETSPTGPRASGLRLFAVASASTHLPDSVRATADARDPHWDDGVAPLPLASELAGPTEDGGDSGED